MNSKLKAASPMTRPPTDRERSLKRAAEKKRKKEEEE
jgi:hypothetical protein